MKDIHSKFVRIIALILLIASISAIDYYTGYEIRLPAFYAITVAFATWYLNFVSGICVAVLVAGIELAAEKIGGKVYSAEWIAYLNMVSRFCIYLFVAVSFSYFRRTINLARFRVRAFEGRLGICACCYRVDGAGGYWIDFPTYLRTNSEVIPEFRRCPVCTRENKQPSTTSK